MPLDHYRTLGQSGLRVSPLCLGAMTFGTDWEFGSDDADSKRIMDRFIDLGGNFIDTANMYTNGHSEVIIGEHFGADRAKRERVVLATKFSSNMRPGDPNGGGASRKAIIGACEESLRRLRTDYIDLYWMHWWDPYTPIEETMDALDDLVRAGKVRYLGFSDTPAWKISQAQTLARLTGRTPLIALQIEYSLLERTVERELTPMAQELGLGVTPWSPLRAGALSGKYTRDQRDPESPGRKFALANNLNDAAFDVIEAVVEVAHALDSTPARVALAWVLSRPAVAAPIIGARRIDQLEDNIKALDVVLPPEALARLEAVSKPGFDFTAAMMAGSGANSFGGLTINGRTFQPGFRTMRKDTKLW